MGLLEWLLPLYRKLCETNQSLDHISAILSTMDTVISVEEDPEIEALSRQTLTTPTSLTLREKPQQCDHTHIDLELGHDIPGLVSPSDPEVRECHLQFSTNQIDTYFYTGYIQVRRC